MYYMHQKPEKYNKTIRKRTDPRVGLSARWPVADVHGARGGNRVPGR